MILNYIASEKKELNRIAANSRKIARFCFFVSSFQAMRIEKKSWTKKMCSHHFDIHCVMLCRRLIGRQVHIMAKIQEEM